MKLIKLEEMALSSSLGDLIDDLETDISTIHAHLKNAGTPSKSDLLRVWKAHEELGKVYDAIELLRSRGR